MFESILIFLSLIIGYYLPIRIKKISIISLIIDIVVILIIFVMGYNFSVFAQNSNTIFKVINLSIIYTIVIFLCNVIVLYLFFKYFNKNTKSKYIDESINKINIKNENRFILIIKSSKYILYLLIGYIVGQCININIEAFTDNMVFILLLMLMFIIGIQLKTEGINLTRIIKNKDALIISIIIVLTSIIPSLFIPFFIDITTKESVMISSGLGWYSLSGVLNTGFLGEYYGISTFLIDFFREIIAIALIPLVKRKLTIEMVGYSANTAMDFCLPIIKNTHGMNIVPLAIGVGLMLSLFTPVLLIMENIIL